MDGMYVDYNALIEQTINSTLKQEAKNDPLAAAVIRVMAKHGITGLKAVAFLTDLLTEFGKAKGENGKPNEDN